MNIRPFRKLVSFPEAMELVLRHSAATGRTEEVPLGRAAGRVLAGEVVSRIDVPQFDRSAMDGYAVRSEDVVGAGELSPVSLGVSGELFAGDVPTVAVRNGTACRVATGAVLPEGADAVVMAEFASEEGGSVTLRRAEPRWGNVSRRGSDIRKGTAVLGAGAVLDPAKVGVLASLGLAPVEVLVRPGIAVISSGNEIAEPGGSLGPAQVYNSNSYALASVIDQNGGQARLFPHIEDTRDAIRDALRGALSGGLEAVAISGGSSVGERDLLAGVLADEGEILFHGVQIKPGKPFLLGRTGRLLVFGIPGYPAAALMVGQVFLAPAVRRMAGLPPERRTVRARLARRLASRLGRVQFLTVRLAGGEAEPVFKGSGAITSLAAADGYIVVPDNVELLERGEEVEVVLF
ncbi:MAG: molybdenum cofactor biosynthesis protein [Euryarchaeota archaeon]|nr:molybdenum cofactor biosynthesis protein [Euryarchaeota archaeon]